MTDRNAYRRYYQRQHGRDRLGKKARRQALSELLDKHSSEYRRLIEEKRAALGLPPPKPGRPKNETVD